jgi:hypothetical protein
MWYLIGVLFFLVLLLVAIRLGLSRQKEEELPAEETLMHRSGIYSVVRKSPREKMADHKPSIEEIRQYLTAQNEDLGGCPLSDGDRERLLKKWEEDLERSIASVEAGDHVGTEFYFYSFEGDDPGCEGYVSRGHFVTREEIFHYPQVLPPFHPGCRCVISEYQGGAADLRDTTRTEMRPFFTGTELPSLPPWKVVVKA